MDRACTALGMSIVLVGSPLFGCAMGGPVPGDLAGHDVASEREDATGTVSFRISLPGGENLGTVSYNLTNGVTTLAGTQSPRITTFLVVVIGGVPAGGGYSIELTATSDDGTITCTGSSGTGISDAGQDNGPPFAVATRQSTSVPVQLICIKNKS
jgi:hypothetical protein